MATTSEFECEFCTKKFTTKGNMVNHQNNANKCLTIQARIEKQQIEKEVLEKERLEKTCEGCLKMFGDKYTLKKHHTICCDYNVNIVKKECDDRLTNTIQDYETKLQTMKDTYEKHSDTLKQDYETQLQNMKDIYETLVKTIKKDTKKLLKDKEVYEKRIKDKQYQNTYDDFYDNIKPLSDDMLNNIKESLTINDVSSVRNFISFTVKNIIDSVYITDISRKIALYKNNDGEIVRNTINNVLSKIYKILYKKAKDFIFDIYKSNEFKISNHSIEIGKTISNNHNPYFSLVVNALAFNDMTYINDDFKKKAFDDILTSITLQLKIKKENSDDISTDDKTKFTPKFIIEKDE
jgi:hypothetical protein